MATFQTALADYLSRDDVKEHELAQKVGCSQASINRYRHGERFPDAKTAELIDLHTSGAVAFATWQADFLARSGISTRQSAAA